MTILHLSFNSLFYYLVTGTGLTYGPKIKKKTPICILISKTVAYRWMDFAKKLEKTGKEVLADTAVRLFQPGDECKSTL